MKDNPTRDDLPPPPMSSRNAAGLAGPPSAPPQQLGVYRLSGRLGQGGMGTVWKAWHTRLKRTVALKTIRAECMGNAPAVVRFQREMEAVGKLDHPNLIRATDAGEDAGIHFLVMEFVEGTDTAQLVLRLGPLPIADACEVVRQAALGLQHAHEAGLVHRDVKPSNLMVATAGQVKVLDLGLALLHAAPDEAGELTGSNQGMGTADYMAPEQWANAHNVDVRADVYSLGCTLYKLLSGRAPFSGPEYSSVYKKMEAHAREPVPPLHDRRPEVPAELVGVLDRMLAKDPAARFATPGSVASALTPFAAGCDLRRLVAEDASAVASASAETRTFGSPAPESGQDSLLPPTVPRPTLRRRRLWWAAAIVAGVGLAVGLLAWWQRHPAGPDPVGISMNLLEPPPEPVGVWMNLLKGPPEPLLWPPAEVPPHFEKDRQRIVVTCEGHGLLKLGVAPPRTAYKLQIGFRQPQWTGGIGLFFGYPNGHGATEPLAFQQILLMPPALLNGRCRLYRSFCTLVPSPNGRLRPACEDLCSEEVEKLGPQEYILEIEVAKNGFLDAVRWDGKTLAVLPHSVDWAHRAPPLGHGIFGIAVVKGSSVLNTARWLITDRD